MEPVLLFRNVSITTDYANFFPVLQEYGTKDRLSRREICARLGIGPGQADRIFHDAQLLKLLDSKWCISPLGRQWVRDVQQRGRPTPETLRTAALNVPLFLETFHALGDNMNPDDIFEYFVQRTGNHTREQDVGSARRRYLEGVLQLPLPRSIPRRSVQQQAPQEQPAPAAPPAQESVLRRALRLHKKYHALISEFSLEEIDEVHAIAHEK